MKLSDAIEGFRIGLLADGFSILTVNVYVATLGILVQYLEDKDVENVSEDDLKKFFAFLATDYEPHRRNSNDKSPLSSASRHRYWKSVRSFFKWAESEKLSRRPDLVIKMPSFENKEIEPLSKDDIEKLLNGVEYTKVPEGKRRGYKYKRQTAQRDKSIILVLLDTGIRAGELCRLRIVDLNLENGELFVRPHNVRKTHSRTVYLGKSARKTLWRYLASRDSYRDEPLFVTRDDRPLTPQRILNLLKRLGKSIGVDGVHPHRFRHTFAIEYLRNGGDIFTLKKLLGHSSMQMVNRYLNLAQTDLANAHRRASPVDRWRL